MTKAKAYMSFILALLLFGSNGVVASAISLPSYQIVYLRTAIGSLALLAILVFSRTSLAARRHPRDFAFVVLSGIAMGVGWLFLYEAYQRVGIGLSSLIYYCGPIIVMALSPVLFKERLGLRKVACFVVVLAGLVLVNGAVSGSTLDLTGIALSAGSAIAFSFLVIFNKKAAAITGLENSAWQLTSAFLVVAVFMIAQEGTPAVAIPAGQWPYVLMLGLLNTGLGCYLYFGVFDQISSQTVASLGYLEPLTAVVLGVAVLGEPMTAIQVTGAALIIGGAIACELVKPAKRSEKTDKAGMAFVAKKAFGTARLKCAASIAEL